MFQCHSWGWEGVRETGRPLEKQGCVDGQSRRCLSDLGWLTIPICLELSGFQEMRLLVLKLRRSQSIPEGWSSYKIRTDLVIPRYGQRTRITCVETFLKASEREWIDRWSGFGNILWFVLGCSKIFFYNPSLLSLFSPNACCLLMSLRFYSASSFLGVV